MEQAYYADVYSRITQLIEWRRYKEALQEIQQILHEDPEDPDALAWMSYIYFKADDSEKALHWAKEALMREPEQSLAWYVRVGVAYEGEDEKAFNDALREALRFDPENAHYYFLQANWLNKKTKFKEAKEQLLQALSIRADAPLYLATLAYTEAMLHNWDAALQLEHQALLDDPENAHVFLYLAWSAGERGDYAQKETYLRSAVRLNPDDKQFQDEFLIALQQNSKALRLFLQPVNALRRLKWYQFLPLWLILFIVFRPLVLLLIVLYALTSWVTKLVVHVKVFGWQRRSG